MFSRRRQPRASTSKHPYSSSSAVLPPTKNSNRTDIDSSPSAPLPSVNDDDEIETLNLISDTDDDSFGPPRRRSPSPELFGPPAAASPSSSTSPSSNNSAGPRKSGREIKQTAFTGNLVDYPPEYCRGPFVGESPKKRKGDGDKTYQGPSLEKKGSLKKKGKGKEKEKPAEEGDPRPLYVSSS
jgi:hypothetical protein